MIEKTNIGISNVRLATIDAWAAYNEKDEPFTAQSTKNQTAVQRTNWKLHNLLDHRKLRFEHGVKKTTLRKRGVHQYGNSRWRKKEGWCNVHRRQFSSQFH